MKKIICLDIDDAIFPSNQTYLGETDDSLLLLEINLKRIRLMIEKYNMEVFITSSWFRILELNPILKSLKYKGYYKPLNEKNKEYYKEEYEAFKLLEKYLNGFVFEMSSGDRYYDVENLLNNDNVVITLDDMDFSNIVHENHLWIELHGLLTNGHTYKIKNFLENK
jgi:hypothetical protein